MAIPAWEKVVLLLHMDGSNGSTSFIDSSRNAKTVTANGNAQLSTAQSVFGGASAQFDGSGDYLSIADTTDLQLGTGDWTVELRARYAGGSTGSYDYFVTIGTTPNFIAIRLTDAGFNYRLQGMAVVVGTEVRIADATNPRSVMSNTWKHLVLQRRGNTMRLFVDGVSKGTADVTGLNITSGATWIGANSASFGHLLGYIDELMIIKGEAFYDDGGFTVPSTAYPDGQDAEAEAFEAGANFGDFNAYLQDDQEAEAEAFDAGPSFGDFNAEYDQEAEAEAFDAAPSFGTFSSGRVAYAKTLGRITHFGLPYITEPRRFYARAFEVPIQFGKPTAIRWNPLRPLNRHVHVATLKPTIHFGTPTAYRSDPQEAEAVAFDAAPRFGTPTAGRVAEATGFDAAPTFGTVTAEQE